jgi:hypothetical protein
MAVVGQHRISTLQAFTHGFREVWRCRRLVFPVYLANLLTAVFAVLPVYLTLHRLTAHRPAAERLVYSWDLEVLAELVMDNPELLSQLQGVFLFVPLAYLLLSQLLLGGVLGALWSYDRPTLRRFGGDAFGHLPGLLWVLVWSALPYALSLGLAGVAFVALEGRPVWVIAIAMVPGLILLLWTDAALDFARVETVTGGITSSIKRLVYGYWAVLKRPVAALAIHLGFGLITLVPLVVLLALPDGLDAGGTAAVAGTFGLRQVVVCLRVGLRVASLSGHMVLFRSIFPAEPAADDETSGAPSR